MKRILAGLAVAFAIGAANPPSAVAEDTLYQRIGGYDAIAAVTDEFIARLEANDRLGAFLKHFSDDSLKKLRQHVVDLICEKTGGPCRYAGRDMKTAHAGVGVTKEDWDRSIAIFGEVLKKFSVPEGESSEIAAIIGPLEKDIVEAE
jgi:hemoglobin